MSFTRAATLLNIILWPVPDVYFDGPCDVLTVLASVPALLSNPNRDSDRDSDPM